MACYKQSNFVIFGGFNKTFVFTSTNYLPNLTRVYVAAGNIPCAAVIFLLYPTSSSLVAWIIFTSKRVILRGFICHRYI